MMVVVKITRAVLMTSAVLNKELSTKIKIMNGQTPNLA